MKNVEKKWDLTCESSRNTNFQNYRRVNFYDINLVAKNCRSYLSSYEKNL